MQRRDLHLTEAAREDESAPCVPRVCEAEFQREGTVRNEHDLKHENVLMQEHRLAFVTRELHPSIIVAEDVSTH